MRLISLLALSFLFCSSAFALSIEGRVVIKKSEILLIDQADRKAYSLTGSTFNMNALKKLKTGDFLSFEGSRDSHKSTITVNALNYVGLRALLGVWIADDSSCYHFSSFTEFSISSHITGKRCNDLTQSPYYTYITSPGTKDWVLLISGQRASYVGDLKFLSSREIQIDLFDSETGDTLRTLHLRK